MKVIISMQEFYDALMTVAKDAGKTYVAIRIDMSTHSYRSSSPRPLLSGYIDGFSKWLDGDSPAEICQKFRALINPAEDPSVMVTDVEFDVASLDEKIDQGMADLKQIASEIPEVKQIARLD